MSLAPVLPHDPAAFLPPVFVINLDERTDRWEAVHALCSRCEIAPIRISAMRASPGWVGCGHSHLKVIQAARNLGLPWILILEDDVHFDPEGIARFRRMLPYLWQHREHWERFSGGPTLPADHHLRLLDIDHALTYVTGYAAHFDLIHSAAYDTILQWTPATGKPIDAFYCDMARDQRNNLRTICTFPHIATQLPSISDISQSPSDDISDYGTYFRYSSIKLKDFILRNLALHQSGLIEIAALHRDWSGNIILSKNDGIAWRKGTEFIGTYCREENRIVVHWSDLSTDVFTYGGGGQLILIDMT